MYEDLKFATTNVYQLGLVQEKELSLTGLQVWCVFDVMDIRCYMLSDTSLTITFVLILIMHF